jgi:hypothetical protein
VLGLGQLTTITWIAILMVVSRTRVKSRTSSSSSVAIAQPRIPDSFAFPYCFLPFQITGNGVPSPPPVTH